MIIPPHILFKWNSITTKIETCVFAGITLTPTSSNEILLQQRLKPASDGAIEYNKHVQMKFYYNKDWNFAKDLRHDSTVMFKWNSITTKIETLTAFHSTIISFSSNEILLQQRLKQ